jgi:hypothetical protein
MGSWWTRRVDERREKDVADLPKMPLTAAQIVQSAYQNYLAYQNQHLQNGGINGLGQTTANPYGSPPLQPCVISGRPAAKIYSGLPREGIRAGEITGVRLWSLDLPRLRSLIALGPDYSRFIWEPNTIVSGDVKTHGVYAYKPEYSYKFTEYFLYAPFSYVIGTVALWGEVIEHEFGYRAEFAKITKLLDVINCNPKIISELNQIYSL